METRHWKRCTWQTNGGLNGVVLASSWEQLAEIILWPLPGSVIKVAPEQLRTQKQLKNKRTDRVVLRDLRRTADILRESGSAKNFEDITETELARR